MHNNQQLNEGLRADDLKEMVHPTFEVDSFRSKMGEDQDVCVISFKVAGKEPGADLVSFIEKGYDFVLDADVSSGEKEGGDYLVFVELQRSEELPTQIMAIMNDLMNLTEQTIEDWRVRYYKSTTDNELTPEVLADIIPLTSEAYDAKYGKDDEEEIIDTEPEDITKDLDAMKSAAGLNVDTVAPKNEYTESLRIAAGIK